MKRKQLESKLNKKLTRKKLPVLRLKKRQLMKKRPDLNKSRQLKNF